MKERLPPDLTALADDALAPLAFHSLPLSKLKKVTSPFGCWPELQGQPITPEEVKGCLDAGEEALRKTPSWITLAFTRKDITPEEARQRHVQKIAYFVKHPATDPITIDVGIPELGGTPGYLVEDGNHRLAGALLRGDKRINAFVMGSPEEAMRRGLWRPSTAVLEQFRRWNVKPPSRIQAPSP